MTRRQKDPLRVLTTEERLCLEQLSRAQREPAVLVARAKSLLAVADGKSYTDAATVAGRRSGDAVAHLVTRFNRVGLSALQPHSSSGRVPIYGQIEHARILAEVQRTPDRERDGTATWSLTTLQRALRTAADGLPLVSTYTIWCVLHDAGYSWQRDRTWCETGSTRRVRKEGVVTTNDPDTAAKKVLIEQAYTVAAGMGIDLWCEDEAGPYPTEPYLGKQWQQEGQPARLAHEYVPAGTAKLLTLLHPLDGQIRVKGVRQSTNAILHPWLQEELARIVATLPPATAQTDGERCAAWERWQAGLVSAPGIGPTSPPLRMLLVLDNLAGHKTPSFVRWCAQNGIMLLYTPLGGSWLNMAESIQLILKRRALDGSHPKTPEEAIAWLEAVARAWNRNPTPFVWGGKRATRRVRQRQRCHAQGGSGACTRRPIRRRPSILDNWQSAKQATH